MCINIFFACIETTYMGGGRGGIKKDCARKTVPIYAQITLLFYNFVFKIFNYNNLSFNAKKIRFFHHTGKL